MDARIVSLTTSSPRVRDSADRGRWAPWVYAAALVWWASSWNLRLSVLMAWLPVEPVWIGSAAVALCVVHRLGRPLRFRLSTAWPLLVLVAGFLPGFLRSSGEGYGPAKVAGMIFVLLPVLVAAAVLLDSREARQAWVWTQAILGVAVAGAAVALVGHLAPASRFTLATVDTIATARLVGAAVLVLLLVGLGSPRRFWWALVVALGCGTVLVHIGSRGPLLAVLLAAVVVVLAGRCFAGHRLALCCSLLVVAAAALGYALSDGGSGGQRILASLEAGLSDSARSSLLGDAVRVGLAYPMGVGWGDFAQHSRTARAIANAQGVAYPHNAFAEAFSEGGVLALLALAIVVVVALWRLWSLTHDRWDAVAFGVLVYWLLNAQVSSDFMGNDFMWIALMSGLATYAPASRPRAAGHSPPNPSERPQGHTRH